MPKFTIEAVEMVRYEGEVEADTEELARQKFLNILMQEDRPIDFIEGLSTYSEGIVIVESQDSEEAWTYTLA